MTVVKFTMDERKQSATLRVKGHVGWNVAGDDIVCAAISILAYTLAQNIKIAYERGLLKYLPRIKLKEGDAIITSRAADSDAYNEILHMYLYTQTGYQVLAHNYPKYVILEMFGTAE